MAHVADAPSLYDYMAHAIMTHKRTVEDRKHAQWASLVKF